MRRITAQYAVEEITTRASIATPPSSPLHAESYWCHHTDDGYPPNDRVEGADDEISYDNPVEVKSLGREVSMEFFLCHIILFLLLYVCKGTIFFIDKQII